MNRPRWGDDLSLNSASVRMAIENDLGGLLELYRFSTPETRSRTKNKAPRRVQAAIKTAWDQDCYKVMLASGRPDAVSFYESVGLKRSGKNFFEARKE
jgi:hypothetical protein